MPVISTDMLGTFNPEAFYYPAHQKHTAQFGQATNKRVASPVVVRPLSENSRVRVKFSYGLGGQNIKIVPHNGLSSPSIINHNANSFGMNIVSRRTNNFFS